MLSTRDARHLRRADKALRSIVAEHPWADTDTPVTRFLAEWRTSFPAATACRLESPTLTSGQLALLDGLTTFTSVGFRSTAEVNEQPLAVVRTMPRLEALAVFERAGGASGRRSTRATTPFILSPSAAIWGELGHLRELNLELPAAAMPVGLLSALNSKLRKLSLRVVHHRHRIGVHQNRGIKGLITDAALAALPLLEGLHLFAVLGTHTAGPLAGDKNPHKVFTGVSLAALTRLSSLTLHGAALPVGVFSHAPTSIRSLDVSHCTGLTDATFNAPCLAGITSLILHDPPEGLSSRMFVGLSALEELNVRAERGGHNLITGAALRALGLHGRLRRLRCFSEISPREAHTYFPQDDR